MSAALPALVVGGSGALGKVLVASLRKHGMPVIAVDLGNRNLEANTSIEIPKGGNWVQNAQAALTEIKGATGPKGVRAVFHVAGGWAGGAVSDPNFLESVDDMYKRNLISAATSAFFSAHLIRGIPDGLCVFTGAIAALGPTPSMVGYGLAKTSTHFLVRSMASDKDLSSRITTIGVLPTVIDTPANREDMPNADYKSWTKPEEISERLITWLQDRKSRPANGSLVKISTARGTTTWMELK